MGQLTSELTRYGDRLHRLSQILYYSSDRTVAQYKKIRMHPMCRLGLAFIKLGLPDVVPLWTASKPEEALIAEAAFKPIWKRTVRNALECVDFGFKAMELLWQNGTVKHEDENEAQKTYKGYLPKLPKSLDGETIDILVNERDGSFIGFWQDSDEKRKCLAEDMKALVFTNQLESGNYYGISDLESIYPYWYDANINRQFHMRWLERKGTGIYKGRYPSGTSDVEGAETENADLMMDLLNGIVEGVVVSVPSDADDKGNPKWDIALLEGEDKNNSFIEHAKYLDETILKGLIIPDKALVQGEMGARASVESFQNLFIARKQDLLNQIVDTINLYFVRNFAIINFGKDSDLTVEAGKLDDDSVSVANQLVQKLLDKGSIEVDKKWLSAKSKIPFEEKEEVEAPEIPEESKEEGDKPEKPEEPKMMKMSEQDRFASMTRLEKLYKLNEIDRFFTTRGEQFVNDLTLQLQQSVDRIAKVVEKGYGKDDSVRLAEGLEINRRPIRQLYKQFAEECYDYAFSRIQSTVEGIYRFAAKNSFITFRADTNADKIVNEIESAVQLSTANALASGYALSEIIQDIKNIVTNYISRNIERVKNDEIGFVFGRANLDYYAINQRLIREGRLSAGREIQRYQYSAILDSKTTRLCESLNGTIVEAGSPIMSKFSTPNHYNCRSIWLAITRDEINDPGYTTDISINPATGRPWTLDSFIADLGREAVQQRTF